MMKCYICNNELATGDVIKDGLCNRCREEQKQQQNNYLYGWICPRCLKVHSPFVQDCDCVNYSVNTSPTFRVEQ